MGTTIFFTATAFLLLFVVELLITVAFRMPESTKTKRILGKVCRAMLALCILLYLFLFGFLLFVGVNLLLKGETKKGFSVLISAVVVVICVYFWMGREWVRYLRERRTAGSADAADRGMKNENDRSLK